MKEDNLIIEKTYNFSLRIIKLYLHLRQKKVERELLIQLLKSGTSIGANVEEAVGAQSKADFIHKLGISYKESRETLYWLRLLKDSKIVEENLCDSFIIDCTEVRKILTSILKTSKK